MIKKALIAAAALLAFSAHAGYAQLAPPQGFGGTTGAHTYAAAANDKVFGRVIHSPGALTANVGGQAVKMPAAYRLAANAPRIAAAVVMQHPAIRIGAAAVGVASWLIAAKLVWDEASQTWRAVDDPIKKEGDLFRVYDFPQDPSWHTSPDGACQSYMGYLSSRDAGSYMYRFVSAEGGRCLIQTKSVNGTSWVDTTRGIERKIVESPLECPYGWLMTEQGCLSPALAQPEFIDRLAAKPMPETVPLELPRPSPLPIEQPSPWINPAPGPNPANQPYRVPTGEPSPIPNTDPQQWRQPYVDIVPAPTPESPWRVDVKPGETISTNPNPVEDPGPGSEEKPTPEDEKSLCEKHPDVAACEKVEVTDKPLPDQPKLYEPKYPDGISGLWNSKIQEIKATPLFNLAPSLLPNVSAGSCPSWKVDLSIDGWTNAGLQDVSPPCWVWDVAKLVIIASALLLARRLIFGG